MVEAVLRYLARYPNRVPRDVEAQSRYAVACLKSFWRRVASRDAERYWSAVRKGNRPVEISLETWSEAQQHPAVWDTYACLQITVTDVLRELDHLGFSPVQAAAFCWRLMEGLEWADIAILLRERLNYFATEEQVRKWGQRSFRRILPELRLRLWGEE
jgi:hypothetical protein